ncbi:hypothetical protein FQA39_LY09583 [Lamprigera yunnana]|nr:hypothetical protein FQA39_LY09583 [Lamprigera yunnana]
MAVNIQQDLNDRKEEFLDGKGLFGDLSETMFGDGTKSCSSSPLEGDLLSDPDSCGMCGERLVVPRVLSCLHVFCEQCLEKKLIGEGGDGMLECNITCITCNQDTKVGSKRLASLPLDVMTINISDVSNSSNLHCTSCTAKEIAISRCCTCHNLLCSHCDSAHRFMRCFEHHKVISLDDMRKDGKKITVHKPLVCDTHVAESLLYYCATCHVPACNECIKSDHKPAAGHQCEGMLDSEMRVRQEVEKMLNESKEKVQVLIKTSGELNNSLEELAHQRSTAKDLINESYHSYKAVLEKCRDDALTELSDLHHERELKIMDITESVEKYITLLDDACKFTARLTENGTIAEIMYLHKIVGTQLLHLINNTPKPEKTFSLEFHANFNNFEKTIKTIFGNFHTESDEIKINDASPLSITTNLPPLTINGPNIGLTNGCTGSGLTNSSPISLATSMQSSFDGDLAASLQGLSLQQSPPAQVNTAATLGFSSMAEYNIAQLASLAETTASAATSPSPSFSALADLFTTDTAYKNLASLAKLGLNNSDNGSLMIRANSPAASLNLSSMNNTLINGFGGVSAQTSPLMTTPDDIITDPLNTIVNQATNNASTLPRTNKVSPMQIRCKFGQLGPSKGQFNSPHGFCLGLEEDIIVADTNNHRIQTGTFKFQFGIPGKEEGQLWYPRKVAVMRISGKYVVCDRGNERSRMQIFTKSGHFIKKIAIRYIDIVAGLAVTALGEIVAVDSVSPTVFVISEAGDLIRWFDCSDYMREPSDIAIHGKEFYVCDFKGHNVVVFSEEGMFLRRIGCENLTNFPNGIDISDAGDVLVGDSHGNRFHVAVFSRDGSLVSEFECPYVKFKNCRILRNHQIIDEHLWVRNGKIVNPEKVFFDEKIKADVVIDCKGAIIAPGFIDIQINGGFGIDFSNIVDNIEDRVDYVSKRLLQYGVTSFCPTIVTSPVAVYYNVLSKINKREGSGVHGATILGIHVEGPFINVEKKGAHPPEYIKNFDMGIKDVMETYGTLKNVSIITLAPELKNSSEIIKELVNLNISVSVGHSMGNLKDGERAITNGANLITHLFNAMLPFHHRDPGLVGLLTSHNIPEDKRVYFGIISDGIHTHPSALRIAYKTHPKGIKSYLVLLSLKINPGLILITDGISAMGLEEGKHNIGQLSIEIKNKMAMIVNTNTLCGSIATMDQCVKLFQEATGCSKEYALEAASLHPAEALGIQAKKGSLNFGSDADFIFLDDDLKVLCTWIAGECVYKEL